MSPTLNGEVLKNIATRNRTSEIMAKALAERKRMRTDSDMTRMWFELVRKGERVDQKEYLQFWKDMQSVGAGSIIYGRKGAHDKFAWNYSLKNVGKAMLEGDNIEANRVGGEPKNTPMVEQVAKTEAPVKRGRGRPKKELSAKRRGRPANKMRFELRPGFTMEITRTELAKLVQSFGK